MAVEPLGNRSAALPAAVRETLGPPTLWAGWLPVLACTVLFAAGASVPRRWLYAPLAASVVLFGLPHGAVDWAALPRAVVGRLDARWIGVVCALYLVGGGAYAAAWFAVPVAAAAAFVALTWFHWGQGDLHALLAVAGTDHLDARWRRGLTVLVRGGLPMLVPLVAFPDRYRTVLSGFAAPFGGEIATWPIPPSVRLALGGAFLGVTLLALAAGYRAADDLRPWAIDAGETALLWAFFLAVPPVFAVGAYFCFWHSVRHVARVVTLDERSVDSLSAGRVWPSLRRFALEAALPTAGALALLAGLWVAAPDPEPTVEGMAALYLVAIAVLTLPHVLVVTWLDRAQGVW